MKVTTTLTALVIGIASMGLAQAAEVAPAMGGHDAYYPAIVQGASTSRAQVLEQLKQAQTTNVVTAGHDAYYPQLASTQNKTREQVVAELQQAQANGDLASNGGHDAYYPAHPAV
ncbi:MAG TPA: DUF4148 domain-containing protein [Castellaniella sp.]|uniref:DUF4148 domain-containing protein n=1 Tax=Castellaniella sp. TaxID=1955812 RepID=UPI002EDD30BD